MKELFDLRFKGEKIVFMSRLCKISLPSRPSNTNGIRLKQYKISDSLVFHLASLDSLVNMGNYFLYRTTTKNNNWQTNA